ncbi:M18 family aminopeptidase [Pokkaliibacter plantistimulans]|uniref:M18 family aminopeptidase n=1 Tax=Proteobacteria bacterium 228 TaxID=2083153 RepID=A0A2S5KR80_9PROT|nr:M18 family aminopeptidase [Pokkaliibacter plantistimulans]PPC77364.1 M18 family aminopeptidase [Pokkaliibacter plantistimulans]
MQSVTVFNEGLLAFLQTSPTPYHAVKNMQQQLKEKGFSLLNEGEAWDLHPGSSYMVTRNGSSIIAWTMPEQDQALEDGIRLVGAHTDSPCLKVKPQPELSRYGYIQLGVEVYGGVLLNPWFDRDLSLAGKVTYRTVDGRLTSHLIDMQRAIAVIPSLAIHLDREVNQNKSVNAQRDLPPILWQLSDDPEKFDLRSWLSAYLEQDEGVTSIDQVLDFDLCFYDTQKAALIGMNEDFIASARLDNLLSCYVAMQSLIEAPLPGSMMICTDHEEVGSASTCGAEGPFLNDVLARMFPGSETRTRVISQSLLISADNAHGIHPNYPDKHDANHGPVLNKGPVIKINNNQRYATTSDSSAVLRQLAIYEEIPVQAFVVRSDMACGSTIGPITATRTGIPTVDVGVPTFAMHSIRELAGAKDAWYLYKILSRFYVQRPYVV